MIVPIYDTLATSAINRFLNAKDVASLRNQLRDTQVDHIDETYGRYVIRFLALQNRLIQFHLAIPVMVKVIDHMLWIDT